LAVIPPAFRFSNSCGTRSDRIHADNVAVLEGPWTGRFHLFRLGCGRWVHMVKPSQANYLSVPFLSSIALLFRRRLCAPRNHVSAFGNLPRPELWLPYVFTSIDDPHLDEIVRQNRASVRTAQHWELNARYTRGRLNAIDPTHYSQVHVRDTRK